MKVCLVTNRLPPARCGIGDYTVRLGLALTTRHDVSVVARAQPGVDVDAKIRLLPAVKDWGLLSLIALGRRMRESAPDWVCLEYVPYLYGRRGTNLWLPIVALWMRARGVRILLTVHEPFVELDTPEHFLVGIIQRVLLWLLMMASEKVAVTTSRWTEMLSRVPLAGNRRVFHLPVGSNLVRVGLSADDRRRVRADLGFSGDDVVIAMLRPGGAGKLFDLAMTVWQQLRSIRSTVKLLIVGQSPSDRAPQPDVHDVGYVSADRASQLLECADIFFLPFVDGVSARRTSVMAAMAHGLPVVTTTGHLTDPVFAASPIVMRPVSDMRGLVEALETLVASPSLRVQQGESLRAFYLQHFDWPVIADRLSAELAS
jgi:glycosyltransferase involved in cell wall biosynthesis